MNTPISNRKALLDNDLDTLATALYVSTDDLWKSHPEITPWRPCVGIAPRISDAELVTLAVMQALLGFTSERRWLRHVSANLPGTFPSLPAQPGTELFKPLRQIIESVNDTLKGQLDLEAHSGRTIAGITIRVMQRILALTAAIWHNSKTGQRHLRSLTPWNQSSSGSPSNPAGTHRPRRTRCCRSSTP